METILTWTGGATDFLPCRVVYGADDFIYAALVNDSSNPIVVKIDPATMTESDRWTGAYQEYFCQDKWSQTIPGPTSATGMCYGSDGYLYVGLFSVGDSAATLVVVKIDPATMDEVDRFEDGYNIGTIVGLVYGTDGKLYAGVYGDTGIVIKIDPTTMTEDARYSEAGVYIFDIAYGDGYIYAAYQSESTGVLKIDPATMSVADSWVASGGEYPWALAYGGGEIFLGCDNNPGVVVKIDPTAMTEDDRWTDSDTEGFVYCLAYGSDGNVYAGLYMILLKIDPTTMDETERWTGTETQYVSATDFDGTYAYASQPTEPPLVNKVGQAAVSRSFIIITP
jgi:hypothetical protein